MTVFFIQLSVFRQKIECVGVGLQKLYWPISGCHVKSRFTVGPLMATIFLKNEIPHKRLCDIFQDGGWTSHKNHKMMFQG